MSVITRFAPSPTGMLHIGGARTALFNLLYARHHNGQFLVRIEDTDIARSTPEAVQAILDGLNWLGITPDAPPVFQAARSERHVQCAEEMIANGSAFRCYATPEELQARRDAGEAARAAAKVEGISEADRASALATAADMLSAFRSPWRDPATPPRDGAPFTVRLRAPDSGRVGLNDLVQGDISVDASEIDDLILLRANGTPTYMLAVVVDDHDMGVTQIIRGDDHLRNALRQTPIYEAMGWNIPDFAHIPLIHGPDGAKLSKRHGALGTLAYRDMGYLPEAVCNYLMRLGWSHGDAEIFSLDEASAVFSLNGVGKGPARIDFDKLSAMNGHYIRTIEHDRLLAALNDEFSKTRPLSPETLGKISKSLPDMRDRGDTIPSLAEAFGFLTAVRPLQMNKKARKALRNEGLDRLALLRDDISTITSWTAHELKLTLQAICETTGLSMGQIGPPLRAALTGGLPAPDIDQVMDWLGQEETIARIEDQLSASE